MSLLVGAILDNADGSSPRRRRDARRRFDHLREVDAAANRVAAWRLLARGVRGGDRSRGGADTPSTRFRCSPRSPGSVRCFAPLNARIGLEEARPIVELVRPRILIHRRETTRATVASSRRASTSDHVGSELAAQARERINGAPRRPGPPRTTRTSSSSRGGSTGRPKGRAVAAAELAAHLPGCDHRAGGSGVVCMFRSSTWPDGRSRWARGRTAAPFTSRRRIPRCCSRPPQRHRADACTRSPRYGRESSSTVSAATTCRRCAKPTPERRRRHPS